MNLTSTLTPKLGVVTLLALQAHISLHTQVPTAQLVPSGASLIDTPEDVLVCWWIKGTSMGDEFEHDE